MAQPTVVERLADLRDSVDGLEPEELPYEQIKALYEIAIQLAGVWGSIDCK